VQQAAFFDRLLFDLSSSFQDSFGPAEVDVGGRQVAKALVVPVVVVVVDEASDGVFESAWQIVVLEQDAVLERLWCQRSILPCV